MALSRTHEYADLFELDNHPAKVVRVTLENAIFGEAMVIRAEAPMTEIPKSQAKRVRIEVVVRSNRSPIVSVGSAFAAPGPSRGFVCRSLPSLFNRAYVDQQDTAP